MAALCCPTIACTQSDGENKTAMQWNSCFLAVCRSLSVDDCERSLRVDNLKGRMILILWLHKRTVSSRFVISGALTSRPLDQMCRKDGDELKEGSWRGGGAWFFSKRKQKTALKIPPISSTAFHFIFSRHFTVLLIGSQLTLEIEKSPLVRHPRNLTLQTKTNACYKI